jgi:hypothetical protein
MSINCELAVVEARGIEPLPSSAWFLGTTAGLYFRFQGTEP